MVTLRFREWLVKELVSPLGPDAIQPMDQMGIIKNGAFPTMTLKSTTHIRRNKPIKAATTAKLMAKPVI